MKKTKPVITIFLILLLLNSCSTIAKGLGGSKKKGSDEFLVEKKAPLVLPPKFGELPEPGKKIDENLISIKENTLSIEEIITQSSTKETNIENKELSSSIENSIIKKINKIKIREQNLDEGIVKNEATRGKKNFLQKFREKFSQK